MLSRKCIKFCGLLSVSANTIAVVAAPLDPIDISTSIYFCDLADKDIPFAWPSKLCPTYPSSIIILPHFRFSSSFLSASSRHVLKISPVAASDTGAWNCHSAAAPPGGDKAGGGHSSEKSWELIVLPGIERVFAFQVRLHFSWKRILPPAIKFLKYFFKMALLSYMYVWNILFNGICRLKIVFNECVFHILSSLYHHF